MHTKRAYFRTSRFVRAAITGLALVGIVIYAIVARPEYRIINNAAHVFWPVANYVGDIISWPVRTAGWAAGEIREIMTLRTENEELHARLSAALQRENEFNVAVVEVARLRKIIELSSDMPKNNIVADIIFDGAALAHDTFFISKGADFGVKQGQAVVNMSGQLIGQVIDSGADFARVRSLTDAKSNIPVRIAGTNVYGFLRGFGGRSATIDFLSDQTFEMTGNLDIITSGIRGVLPDGIYIGKTQNKTDVIVANPVRNTAVLVLEFDDGQQYRN